MASPYQSSNTPADLRHSSKLSWRQRLYVVEVRHPVEVPGSEATHVANVFVTQPDIVFRVQRLPSFGSAACAAYRRRSRVG